MKDSELSYFETALITGKIENLSINEDNLTTGAEGFESGATNIDDNLGFDNNNDDDDDDDGEGGCFGGEDDAEAWDLDDELDIGDDDIVNENVPGHH